MRHLSRHTDALAESRVRVDRLADVDGVSTHLNRQRNLTNHVARMRADHATAQNLAVAVRFRARMPKTKDQGSSLPSCKNKQS